MSPRPEVWSNWAGDQRWAPQQVARPANEAELVGIVGQARERGLTVRAAGSRHSFTDIAATDGLMVDTSALRRVVAVDPATRRVTVEAGITLHALGPVLAGHGLALENQGDIDAQSVAGALATATHGTGARFGNLSARAVGMRLVTAGGEILDLTQESDPEGLLAARVSLGALGVVSQVTLECSPLFTLERHDLPRPLGETLDRLDEHVDTHDHFELFVWPYTRAAMTRSTQRTDNPPRPAPRLKREYDERLIQNGLLSLICRAGRRVPRAVPSLNRAMAAALSEAREQDHAYKVYACRRDVHFTESEYAIPRACAREALERAIELVERRRLPILFPFEMRFAAGDDALLSTAHGRDTCYIAAHQYVGMDYESFFRGFEEIMSSYGGRPHWGKRHYQTAATLRDRFPGWDRFQAVRARLDPDGVFANGYTRRVLGPVAAPVTS
jgi:L-gulono-1,4-lactone dehydrogenase